MVQLSLKLNIMILERGWLKVSSEGSSNHKNLQYIHDECKRYLDYHIILTMTDGQKFDGIIVSVEPSHIVVLVGEDVINQKCGNKDNHVRRPIGGGFHGGGGFRRFRRFRPRNFPLGNLAALALLQYPYVTSPYPYYYYDDDYDYEDDYEDSY